MTATDADRLADGVDDAVLRGLIERIADRVAGELTDRRTTDAAGGWSVADERSLARHLVIDALEGEAAARLRAGTLM